MDANDVEFLERETVYHGYTTVARWRLRHRTFAGPWSGPIQREVIERGHAAAVLPYDPARDEVVLIEQFRPGALGAGMDPWIVEIVAGIIEPDEPPEAVVTREALEEAGCRVTELVPITRCLVSPGVLTETVAIFCGRTETLGLGGTHGLDHEGEDIRAFVVGLDSALAMLAEGRIANAVAVIALQWLALNRERIRRSWR
jgi:ADP-ribose pyrophosphatase